MLREIIISDTDLVKSIHQVAAKIILTWSTEVLFEWRQVFNLSMHALPNLDLRNSIERSMQMCDKTQPLVTRISGAYLLGKIVKRFT